jgi:hypothetical protein
MVEWLMRRSKPLPLEIAMKMRYLATNDKTNASFAFDSIEERDNYIGYHGGTWTLGEVED